MTPARRLTARNPRTGVHDFAFDAVPGEALKSHAEALRAAQPAWAGLGFAGRAEVLRQLAEALRARRGALAAALEADTGRRRIAGIEADSVIGSILGWSAATPTLPDTGWTPGRTNPALRHRATWVPYPLVGVIAPWNFPLLLSMIDTVPALLAGCAVLVKPSEVTPRFAPVLADAIAAVPALAGVLAVVPGDGETGAALVGAVDCVCFTGSVATGRKVAVAAAQRLIPAFLELGGKDPLIVLEGADLGRATDAALRGSVLSTGQACQSIERILVARPIYDAFVDMLVHKAGAVRPNTPDITRGTLGPIIFERQAEILRHQVEDAVRRGARLHCGGVPMAHGGGLWMAPTVLTGVPDDADLMVHETFGPVMPVRAFDTVDEAVALANAGEYGLSGAVFAATPEEAEAVGERLEVGAVSLNDAALTALFHEAGKQAFKSSGLGPSRMGTEGLTRFLRRRALIAQTGAPVPLAAFAEDA